MAENGSGRDMLDKVRKLLAKAEGASTPQEGEAYNAKAAELIATYGIEQALLDATKTGTEKVLVGDRIVRVPAPYATEKAILLHNVAEPLRVNTVRLHARLRSEGYTVHMFGFPSDLERVDLLFTSLLLQASLGVATIQPPYGVHPVRYRKGWISGFIAAVRARLDAAENRAKKEADDLGAGPSTDLVLADRKAIVDRRVSEVYPKVEQARNRKVSASAYQDGQAAGRRADLGGTGITRASGKALNQ